MPVRTRTARLHDARDRYFRHMRASGYRKCARALLSIYAIRFCVSGQEPRDGITYSDGVVARFRSARLNRLLLMGHAAYPNRLGTNAVAKKLLRRAFYIRGIALAFPFRSRAFSSNFPLVTDGKQYTFVRDAAVIFPCTFYSHVDIFSEFNANFLEFSYNNERETQCSS